MRLTHVVRAGVAVAAAAAAALAFPAAASAHVTVNPGTATQGGYTKVTFRVPNERDDASTTKLEIALPTDKPIASVSLKPVQGWTAATETSKLATPVKTDDGELTEAVSKITWTASAGAEIKPHTFQEFDVSLGPLPVTDQLVFKALQTYSNGEIVRWIDEPAAGAEAEHPAPVLKLTPKAGASAPASAAAGPAAVADDDGDDDGDGAAIGLGAAGLVLGLAGLVVAVLAFRRAAPRGTA
ncbi:YcnI family protein [Dactylosporangium aurantiacum]|uniref:YcnI family protein n=2 Tax=Dactylosporangium aurantiacum TaxID=35754 RepID=A0A9Q9MHX6_9ACTN|nr:YcnI family protein [Dactylosporangium aurantiacum]MDG6102636.1 YcnI family protein [Dactylosporangium aurantiacum]UWZ53111.1 YcnI family protein [Dactylosporangium aurantiacum]